MAKFSIQFTHFTPSRWSGVRKLATFLFCSIMLYIARYLTKDPMGFLRIYRGHVPYIH